MVFKSTGLRWDTWNTYNLQISSPPQTFYLNRGAGGLFHCFTIDYTKTITVAAGAKVTLTADPVDGVKEQIQNIDRNGRPLVVPGVPPAPAAFNGQFIQMDVLSIR